LGGGYVAFNAAEGRKKSASQSSPAGSIVTPHTQAVIGRCSQSPVSVTISAPMPDTGAAQLAINTSRTLSIDAPQQALGRKRYVGTSGRIIGMQTFGASAPLKELQRKFGFEPDHVAAAAKGLLCPKELL